MHGSARHRRHRAVPTPHVVLAASRPSQPDLVQRGRHHQPCHHSLLILLLGQFGIFPVRRDVTRCASCQGVDKQIVRVEKAGSALMRLLRQSEMASAPLLWCRVDGTTRRGAVIRAVRRGGDAGRARVVPTGTPQSHTVDRTPAWGSTADADHGGAGLIQCQRSKYTGADVSGGAGHDDRWMFDGHACGRGGVAPGRCALMYLRGTRARRRQTPPADSHQTATPRPT